MAFVVLYTVVSALSAIGSGSIASRLLRIRPNAGERGLLGLLWFGMLAALVHFFVPISAPVQYALLTTGLIGCVLWRKELGGLATVGFAILAFGVVFFQPSYVPYHDNGLYHVPTLLWNTQTAATPGLANLHGRLGFNSILFLISPIVTKPEFGWIANSLVASFTLLACLERLRDHAKGDGRAASFWFLAIAVAAFTFNAYLMNWLGILNADAFVAALIVYSIFLLFEYFEDMRPDTTPALMLLLTVFAVMIKLAAAPLLAVSVGTAIFRKIMRPSRKAAFAAAGCLAIWIARGFLLSGCAAYPVAQTCVFSLPWAVGHDRTVGEAIGIRSYARAPGVMDYQAVLSNWKWFKPWFADARRREPIPELGWACLLGLWAVGLRALAHKKIDFASLSVGAFLVGCIAFWFWSAPDPRFGAGYLGAMLILCLAFTAASLFAAPKARGVGTAVLVPGMAAWMVHLALINDWWKLPVIPPKTLPFAMRTVDGPWGIPLRAPDQTNDQCWDTQLPCMPWSYLEPIYLERVRWRTLPTHGATSPFANRPASVDISLPIRVNAGGIGYTDHLGHYWQADVGTQDGWAMSTNAGVGGTADPALYQTAHYSDNGKLLYRFVVPNGDYVLVLKFAEIWHASAGKRQFNIAVNGKQIGSNLDICASAGGPNTAFDLHYPVVVTAGEVLVGLTAELREPVINAIEILPAQTPQATARKESVGVPRPGIGEPPKLDVDRDLLKP